MNSQELATAFLECTPVKMAILNNGYLGMVRQWQQLFYQKRYSGSCLRRGDSPDFVKLAEAYGLLGLRATQPRRGGAGHQGGPRLRRAGAHGFPGRRGGKRLPDGGAGRPPL